MLKLLLKKGDQISLPSYIHINQKRHNIIYCSSPKIDQYADLHRIMKDLSNIESSIKTHLESLRNNFEYFRSPIITYRKCFNDSSGKLEKKRDLKDVSTSLLDFHDELIALGNKYIAHADKSSYFQSQVGLVLNDHGQTIEISIMQLSFEDFKLEQYKTWLELITILKDKVQGHIKLSRDSILKEHNLKIQA